MPQMAPINWLMLFMFFMMTFIIFNTMNYYSFNYSIKTNNFSFKKSKANWKW